jgi:hypothetical protein
MFQVDRLEHVPQARGYSRCNVRSPKSTGREGILDEGALPPPISDTVGGGARSGLADAEEYWHVFSARREALLERVLSAAGDENPEIKIVHNQFGPLSWRECHK